MTDSAALPGGAPVRVLFVDDDEGYLRAVRRLLRPGPAIELLVANDGDSARLIVDDTPPDLIVMDVYMPDLDGIAYCRRLKGATKTRATTVVIVSAAMTASLDAAAREAGASYALDKVADLDELFQLIRTFPRAAAGPRLARASPDQVVDELARDLSRACATCITLDEARRAGQRGLDIAATTYDPAERRSLEDWVRHQVRAEILDAILETLRARSVRSRGTDDAFDLERASRVRDRLRSRTPALSFETHLIVSMRDERGYRFEEIAAALQLPIAHVRTEHARGQALLLTPPSS